MNIAIIYGGKSVEHDISIITALQVMKNLPVNYTQVPIYITREGKFLTGKNFDKVDTYISKEIKGKEISFSFGNGSIVEMAWPRRKMHIDAAIVCCHGLNGEDGSVAALLQLAGIPHTSPSILSAAIGMDKSATKIMLEAHNILTTEFIVLFKDKVDIKKVVNEMDFPLIVKPANLGSSIGISVCRNEDELKKAVSLAFEFDEKVLVERYIEKCREFNCACFLYKGKVICSKVAEVSKGEIFSFDEKYLAERNSREQKIPTMLRKDIQELAERTYRKLELFGVVRIDLLYDESDDCLYVNEVNTVPGSLAFYLFPQKFDELLEVWIEEAIARRWQVNSHIYSYKSDALKIFKNVINSGKGKR